MSKDDSKTMDAIEVIYALFDDIKKIDKKIDIIDNNVKLLNNKVSKLTKLIGEQTTKEKQQPTAIAVQPGVEEKKTPVSTSKRLILGNIKTFGYITNKAQEAIPDVQVNVYNEEGEVVKDRKTDKNGYWEVRLPPGAYGVEYKREGFKAVNVNIRLDESMKSFEVGK